MLSFFSSRRNWDSPTPHPQASVPPFWFRGGGAHSVAGKWYWSPNSDEGTYTVVLFTYTYFVVYSHDCKCADGYWNTVAYCIVLIRSYTAKTQSRKFEKQIFPGKELHRLQSQFLNSCFCERFRNSADRFAYSAAGK